MARKLYNPMDSSDVLTRDLAQDSIDRDCAMYEQRRRDERKARYQAIKDFDGAHANMQRCSILPASSPIRAYAQFDLLASDADLLYATGQVR